MTGDRSGARGEVVSRDLRIPSKETPGLVLAATLHLPGDAPEGTSLPGIVVGHGAGSGRLRHATFSQTAAAMGFAVLTIDFRGHGNSGGSVDEGAHNDVVDAAEMLRAHPLVDAAAVCFRGSSMGAYLGVQAAYEAGFAALALLCPANERVLLAGLDDLDKRHDDGAEHVTARMDREALRAALHRRNVFDQAGDLSTPTLIVHARGDETVPFEDSLSLAARLQGATEIVLLPGGDHGTAQSSPQVHARTARWLKDVVHGLSGGFGSAAGGYLTH